MAPLIGRMPLLFALLYIIMTNRKKGKAETEIKHTLVNCNGPSTLLGYCVIDVGEVINGDGLLCKSPM